MTTLLVNSPGQVVAFQGDGLLPMAVFLDGWPGFPAINAILTQIGSQSSGIFQHMHTMQDFIHTYIFGENIGQVTLGGLAFSQSCFGGASGLEQIAAYYGQYRISNYGRLLSLQIGISGAARVRGFLVGSQIQVVDVEHQLCQFSLQLNTFPPEAAR